jgi:HK97 family phage portal protein
MIVEAIRAAKRSVTYTSSLTNPSDELFWGLGGMRQTASGQSVNEYRALALPAYLQGVRIISEAFSVFPMSEFELSGNGRRVLVDDETHRLVHDEPNDYMTADVWNMVTLTRALLWGRAYDENVWDRRRTRVVEIHPIHPSRVSIENWIPKNSKTTGQRLKYHVVGDSEPLDQEDVTHIRGPGDDSYEGWSPIQRSMESLGVALATQEHAGKFWKNGAKLLGVLQHDAFPGKEKTTNFEEKFAKATTGEGAYRAPVLPGGMKFIPISMPMDQAQFLETRRFSIIEIAQILNMPPAMLGQRDASYNNEEQLFLRLFKLTLLPWAVRVERQRARKLLTPEQRRSRYFKFNLSAYLRPDSKTQAEVFHWALEDGYYKRDEVRELLDKDEYPDGFGQVVLYPVNKAPAEIFMERARLAPDIVEAEIERGQPTEPVGEPKSASELPSPEAMSRSKNIDAAFGDAFSEACKRLARVESDKVKRAVKKPNEYLAWADSFQSEHSLRVRSEFAPLIAAYREAVSKPSNPGLTDSIVTEYGERLRPKLRAADAEAIASTADAAWIIEKLKGE